VILCYLLLLHFVADFLLQSRQMGQRKSEQVKWLVGHLAIQFAVFLVGGLLVFDNPLLFALLNTIIHGAIDWNIWKAYKWTVWKRRDPKLFGTIDDLKKHWKYWEDHLFYTTIGLDQMLHTATIILLYGWLK